MKPNEQLSWALVAITLIALPKWALALVLALSPETFVQLPLKSLPMILVAGLCSLRLLDISQPLAALFGIVASSFSTKVLNIAGYEYERYQVAAFFPAVIWVIAATYPDAGSNGARRAALMVSGLSLALFVTIALGYSPFFWPALTEEGFRVWEWAAAVSLPALVVVRLRTGRFRLPVAKAKALSTAFGPALLVIFVDLLIRLVVKVGLYEQLPDLNLLVIAANLALGWGIFALTRAEVSRHKESRHAAEEGRTHRH